MDLTFYDDSFRPIEIIDIYTSCIWTEAFRAEGEFTLTLPAEPGLQALVDATRWVGNEYSMNLMDIRTSGVKADIDAGDIMTIKGVSLETLMKQRILLTPVTLNSSLASVVQSLLNTNFISPTDTARKISNMVLRSPFTSTIANSFLVKTSRKNLSIYELLNDFTEAAKVGWSISFVNGLFVFDLMDGNDYTSATSTKYVEFSRDFDNLSNSEYSMSDMDRFTKAIVAGTLGSTAVTSTITNGATGVEMREIYLEASGVESKTASGADMTAAAYKTALTAYGQQQYAKDYTVKSFTCEVDPYRGYIYGSDYALGDLVMVKDQYGYSERSRVTEVTYSADVSGLTISPTFEPDADHTIDIQQ